jgi:hypothetical protein
VLLLSLFFLRLSWALFKLPFSKMSFGSEAAEEAALAERQARFQKLDFESIERVIGRTLPPAYKDMFAPGSPWLEQSWTLYPKGLHNDEVLHWVEGLEPPHLDSLTTHPSVHGRLLCFAVMDYGEYRLLLDDEHFPVFVYELDVMGVKSQEKIADSLDEFLSWPRE